jgi:hypothetical protein
MKHTWPQRLVEQKLGHRPRHDINRLTSAEMRILSAEGKSKREQIQRKKFEKM